MSATAQQPAPISAEPVARVSQGVDWRVTIWLVVVHLGAIAGLFFFTWQALLLTVVLSWLTGGIGICMGYHRLLTHNSFKTYRPIRWVIALLGNLAGQGPPLMWVATHRKHHDYSDQEGDPHSPRDGAWWSHMFWLLPHRGKSYYDTLFQRYAPDLLKDPAMRLLEKTFLLWYFLLGGLLLAVGWIGWDLRTGLSFLFWGMFVRLVYVLHVTWLINSATHIWGYRNYETSDDSRNIWWVALLSYGEGWHNNHHAFQRVARYGHRWWEFDITYVTICLMERLGLAWNVVRDIPAGVRTARSIRSAGGESDAAG
ncbi:MAG: fatty acid desaturase [Planctomycetales bacterium]|nr:fatty acid desaturase [Planctomycetales bacterium]